MNLNDLDTLTKSFVAYERMRGIKRLRQLPYELKPFFSFLEECDLDLVTLSVTQAQEYQTWLGSLRKENGEPHYQTLSIRDLIRTVRNFHDFLKYKKLILSNPFLYIKGVKEPKTLPNQLPQEKEMKQILDLLKEFWKGETLHRRKQLYRIHVMAEVLYSTGMRINELAMLAVEDVNLERKEIHIRFGKGGKERVAFLTDFASQVLKIFIEKTRPVILKNPDSPHLFGFKNGKTLDVTLNKILKEIGAAFEIQDFTSHKIRHTLGYHFLRRGCDVRFIQSLLGHDDLESTSLYTKIDKEDLKETLDAHLPRRFHHEKF